MYLENKTIGINWLSDVLLLTFPVWIPLLYGLSRSFPSMLVLFFVLREMHFGATWLFFCSPENRTWFRARPAVTLVGPLLIATIVVAVLAAKGEPAAFFLTNLFSSYHVLRQSYGISKLYSGRDAGPARRASFAFYLTTAAFLIVGALRFYFAAPFSDTDLRLLTALGTMGCLGILAYNVYANRGSRLSLQFYFSLATGMTMYIPYCFVGKAEEANIVGLGMHWLQYLAIALPVTLRKGQAMASAGRSGVLPSLSANPALLAAYLVAYAFVIFLLKLAAGASESAFHFAAIALVLFTYNLHFYFDAFLWRFSVPAIQREVGTYVFR